MYVITHITYFCRSKLIPLIYNITGIGEKMALVRQQNSCEARRSSRQKPMQFKACCLTAVPLGN